MPTEIFNNASAKKGITRDAEGEMRELMEVMEPPGIQKWLLMNVGRLQLSKP
ncbi:MAG: hypothetical protein ACR2LM_16450 [Pyrinomonadaceae bacterium]